MDSTGRELEVDVREDEEQERKLQEILDLLLAAGYFRARIKGLSPFDKVVGGITWSVSICSYDVDVDLLFQENSSIGQKIALTEKLVAVLFVMKCPHRIEPHQIQGLDFIHIHPVVQWLVRKAIEAREEMGDYARSFALSQFKKMCSKSDLSEVKSPALRSLSDVKATYAPRRKYRPLKSLKVEDEMTRVQCTLLEYGRKYGVSPGEEKSGDGHPTEAADKEVSHLLDDMTATGRDQVAASAVGGLVSLQSQEIQQMASQYARGSASVDNLGQGHGHQRVTSALQKQLEINKAKVEQMEAANDKLREAYDTAKQRMTQIMDEQQQLDEAMSQVEQEEQGASSSVLQTLRHLVVLNESLKQQEQQFRGHCKEELVRLQGEIDKLEKEQGPSDEIQERLGLINNQCLADSEKLKEIRLLLARKNREIAMLRRRIDEVPTRAELSQYQKRFIELYNEMGKKFKDTKQFYTLYNTLEAKRLYLNQQVDYFNSIFDNYEQAMSSPAYKEEFLKQLEQIVNGTKQTRVKLEKRKQDEKMKRDTLSDEHLGLIEKQRLYFKTVKDFQQECHKNELIMNKLKSLGL